MDNPTEPASESRASAPAKESDIPSAGLLTMRDKSVPLEASPEPSDIFPSREILEGSIDRRPDRPQVSVQDSTGAYRRYEDDSKLVRNPELGPYPLAEGGRIDSQIVVSKSGEVRGDDTEEEPSDVHGEVDLGLLGRQAQEISSLCDIYRTGLIFPEAPGNLNIFIDSSGSMGLNFYVAPATTCAYQAALSALNRRVRVRVLNFSRTVHVVGPTRDKQEIAQAVAWYEGASTRLPTEDLTPLSEEDSGNDIVIITDGVIDNYPEALPYFKTLLYTKPYNNGYLIIVGKMDREADCQKFIEEFRAIGFRVLFHS